MHSHEVPKGGGEGLSCVRWGWNLPGTSQLSASTGDGEGAVRCQKAQDAKGGFYFAKRSSSGSVSAGKKGDISLTRLLLDARHMYRYYVLVVDGFLRLYA